ncbi:hypothetical protein [Yunchengibacter salinarum]|uniref:hypothetical protein n=1 Tax=Yunchengibacter salinarum TaxID=3133399 RepID=UPI0035B584EE
MNALDSRIRDLVSYARSHDGEDRSTLFRNLIDLFLTNKAPGDKQVRSQILDVLEALIPHVEADERRIAADLLAGLSKPPMDLVMRLSRDRAALAAPLLRQAPYSEDDVITLIEETGRDHHQELSARDDLTANAWVALARATPGGQPGSDRRDQSALALWRDDLGLHPNKAQDNDPAPGHGAPAKSRIEAEAETQAGTPPGAQASAPTREASAETDADMLFTEPDPISPPPDPAPPETSRADQSGDEGSPHPPEAPAPPPGGWSWASDRDGLVVDTSPNAAALLGSSPAALLHTPMMDLLALNEKLGHPVARAFQRRGPIHDAPIFLASMPRGRKYWMLDATPRFTADGQFLGYAACLSPAHQEADGTENTDDPVAAALRAEQNNADRPIRDRLADLALTRHRRGRNEDGPDMKDPEESGTGESGTEEENPFAQSPEDSLRRMLRETFADTSTFDDPAPVDMAAQHTKAQAQAPTTDPYREALVGDGVDDLTLGGDMTPDAAAKTTPRTESRVDDPDLDAIQQAVADMADAAAAGKAGADNRTESATAGDMLAAALSRISQIARSQGQTDIRLQAEIARACLKILREDGQV